MSQKTHYDWLWPWVQDRKIRTVIDCGGCLGHWTMFWHDKVKQIELFEPNKSTLTELKQNIQNLKNINIHEYALGDRPGMVSMDYVKDDHIGTYAITEHKGDIEIKTLDSFNFTDVDIMKIDVEGYEVPLLLGAKETILNNRPWIQIEANETGKRYGRQKIHIFDTLTSFGMRRVAKEWPDQIWSF